MKTRGARPSRARGLSCPSVAGDLQEFDTLHRPHGELTAQAGKKTLNGYRLRVTCACGVVFERWVTPEERGVDHAAFVRWKADLAP
jgi:hypothetical protein